MSDATTAELQARVQELEAMLEAAEQRATRAKKDFATEWARRCKATAEMRLANGKPAIADGYQAMYNALVSEGHIDPDRVSMGEYNAICWSYQCEWGHAVRKAAGATRD